MSRLVAGWDRFWHTPTDPRLAAVLRIGMGVLLFLLFLLQAPYVLDWWGDSGMMPQRVARRILDSDASSLLLLLPASDAVVWTCWGIVLVQSLLLIVGWQSHLQAACLFVWLVSFQHRNLMINDGEDAIARLFCFYLIFAPISSRWSLDARQGRSSRIRSGWAVRMIQIQTVFTFFVAGLEKLPGRMWRDGTAMFHIFRLDDFYPNIALPTALTEWLPMSQVMSWGTLVVELSLPLLVWIPPLRRPTILVGIGFHLALELLMNLYLFEWFMTLGWLAFVRPEEDMAWARDVWARLRGRPVAQGEGGLRPT